MNDVKAADALLNKVPAVTRVFWLIKIMSTTVGEAGADFQVDPPLTSKLCARPPPGR
jgi:uncharacterized membrane-anchored protein